MHNLLYYSFKDRLLKTTTSLGLSVSHTTTHCFLLFVGYFIFGLFCICIVGVLQSPQKAEALENSSLRY